MFNREGYVFLFESKIFIVAYDVIKFDKYLHTHIMFIGKPYKILQQVEFLEINKQPMCRLSKNEASLKVILNREA